MHSLNHPINQTTIQTINNQTINQPKSLNHSNNQAPIQAIKQANAHNMKQTITTSINTTAKQSNDQ